MRRNSYHPERKPMARSITFVELERAAKALDKKLTQHILYGINVATNSATKFDELESRIKLLEEDMDHKWDKRIVVRYVADPKIYKKKEEKDA